MIDGFAHPNRPEFVAGLDGHKLKDRRMCVAGFPPDRAAEGRQRRRQNRLRQALQRAIGSVPESELVLLLNEERLSFRDLAQDTVVVYTTLWRWFGLYLTRLKETILAEPELRKLFSEFVDIGDLTGDANSDHDVESE